MKHIKTFENYIIGDKESEKRFMSSLYNVGITKVVGYLPIGNIPIYGNDTVENVIQWVKNNNLEYKIFTEEEAKTSTGALYIYDYNMLNQILLSNKDVLYDAGVPLDPHDYINYIASNIVYQHLYPLAYEIIGKTFNDERFR
jgi:hypothetical protein